MRLCWRFCGNDWRRDDRGLLFRGTELIGIAAGNLKTRRRIFPRGASGILAYSAVYVFAILIISLIIPYTDPNLLRNDVKDISVSPFTLVFQHAGLLSAAAIMNAVILTAVLSAGNSGCMPRPVCSTPACDGKAPRILRNCPAAAYRAMRFMPPP